MSRSVMEDLRRLRPGAPARLIPHPLYTHFGEPIEKRELTSTRLTQIYLERLERFDPKLRCVITLTSELALAAVGGAGGIGVAASLIRMAPVLLPKDTLPAGILPALDVRVAAFAVAVAFANTCGERMNRFENSILFFSP